MKPVQLVTVDVQPVSVRHPMNVVSALMAYTRGKHPMQKMRIYCALMKYQADTSWLTDFSSVKATLWLSLTIGQDKISSSKAMGFPLTVSAVKNQFQCMEEVFTSMDLLPYSGII
jgi:hypothetical protein